MICEKLTYFFRSVADEQTFRNLLGWNLEIPEVVVLSDQDFNLKHLKYEISAILSGLDAL